MQGAGVIEEGPESGVRIVIPAKPLQTQARGSRCHLNPGLGPTQPCPPEQTGSHLLPPAPPPGLITQLLVAKWFSPRLHALPSCTPAITA